MRFEADGWKKLSDDSYPRLHEFLAPADPEEARRRLERIRVQLVRMFVCYGATDPEALTEETLDRAAVYCERLSGPCVGPPFPFFRVFAKRVFQRSVRDPHRAQPLPPSLPSPEPDPEDESNKELMSRCLDDCLDRLSGDDRGLVLGYYRGGEKRAKIEHRRELAEERGLGLNALRIKVCRLRARLRACVLQCVESRQSRS